MGDDGIKQLYQSFITNNRSKVCIDTLIISHNNLTLSSAEFMATLLLEWNVKSIIFNDISQHYLNEEVLRQVLQNPVEQSNNVEFNINGNRTVFARLSKLEYIILGFNLTSSEVLRAIFKNLQPKNDFNATNRLKSIIHVLKDCTTINYLNLRANILQFEMDTIATLIRIINSWSICVYKKCNVSSLIAMKIQG